MRLGDAFIRVLADTREAEKTIGRIGDSPSVRASGTRVGDVLAGGMRQKLASGLAGAKGGILTGLGLAGGLGIANIASNAVGSIVDTFGKAVDAASDLNETVSKVGVVFGKSSQGVLEWGKTAAIALGMSTQQALEAAATYGNLFVSMGMGQQASAGMSTRLVQLAADLASFNNTSPDDALLALRSGLVGEVEPLRRYGVNLSEVTLKQKAMELGLVSTTTGILPPAIRTQAAYALILDQTKTAQGDFARTATGAANEQRTAAAKTQDSLARLGKRLLPIAQKIIPALADAFGVVVDVLGTVLDVVGPVVGALVSIGQAIVGALTTPFKIVAQVVGGVVSTIIGVIKNFIGIAAAIPGPWQAGAASVRDSLEDMQNSVESWGKDAPAVQAQGAAIAGAAADGIQAGTPAVAVAAGGLADAATGPLEAAAPAAGSAGKQTASEYASGLREKRSAVDAAWEQLLTDEKSALTRSQEASLLAGRLTSSKLAEGLRSGDPIVRAQAVATRDAILGRLAELQTARGLGASAMDKLNAGIRSRNPVIRQAAQDAKAIVLGELRKDRETAAGQAAAKKFAASLKAWMASPAGKAYIAGAMQQVAIGLSHGLAFITALSGGGAKPPSHQSGVWDLAMPELAQLHAHEMVIPAPEATAIREGEVTLGPAGGGAGGPLVGSMTINNPVPESASVSVPKALRRVQVLAQLG
ncbi:MAG TPA: hypothetical protein VGQ64_07875 [Candidatus Limnocylindrales bacterium]|jgi:hypothetical protein|nr:hypothetical protein [Candidatus Limnocylindrales bacterium]